MLATLCTRILLVAGVMLPLLACETQELTILEQTPISESVPLHFPPMHYSNPLNPITKEGIELGRRLFFDVRLSSDGSISCGSCHKQQFAFSDGGKAFSEGVDGQFGIRHSPALFNLAWHSSFMWDGGINHIEIMPFAPLTNPVEMGNDINNIIATIKKDEEYQNLFYQAFDDTIINDKLMFWAFAQFLSSLVSAGSKYDMVIAKQSKFTKQEAEGYQIFSTYCNQCHTEPLFTNFSFERNSNVALSNDLGRALITQLEQDASKFKVPSLRNLKFTAPYFHNGSMTELTDVIAHYIQNESLIKKEGVKAFSALTKQELDALVAFINTLNDESFIQNPN